MERTKMIIGSILAGVFISIGCIAFLSTGSAWVFPIGLFLVCSFSVNLFTGNVCFAKLKDIPDMLIVLVCNVFGASMMGLACRFFKPSIINNAVLITNMKLKEGLSLIPLAILCNVLIFSAVALYHQETLLDIVRLFALYFSTGIFVCCGFEHCVANAFYFALAANFGVKTVAYLIVNAIFNAVGGVLAFRIIEYINIEK
ncbi:MAG: formate/nitrite transporter family protein [Bacteroidaceae bacterium]|nr:formate/nitrite transporter family protein [Bacteroidaceae bacterium]